MKRILALLAVLAFPVVGSTPVFGQDSLEKIKELANTDSVHVPALLQAILQDETETVKTLIKEGEDVNEYWYYREDDPHLYIGYTPLELATRLGDLDIMRLLLDNGANLYRLVDGYLHVPALMYADDVEIAQLLLDRGALVDGGIGEGGTVLDFAAEQGNTDVVKLLIANGADVNAYGEVGDTPLHAAKNIEIAKILIDNGADIHADCDCGTPLHTAEDAEIAQLLIDNGADVNAYTLGMGSPLHTANSAEIAQLLIDHGADVNAHTYGMRSPLHTANSAEIAQILIDNDADVNVRDKNDNTPLHSAIFYMSAEIVEVLLENGADINAKNDDGHTPLDIAIERGQDEVANLLREHGGVTTNVTTE